MARLNLVRLSHEETAMPLQTADRAKHIIDRAAGQKKFKPGITHRRLFDKQVKTPGKVKPNVTGMEWLKREDMEPVGHQEVHLKHIASEQPTVSAHHVKRKIDEITAGKKQAPAKLLLHNGVYHVLDGNHGITAHRALGHATVHADVWKLKDTTKKSR